MKEVTLIYESKSSKVKVHGSLHPICINAQMDLPPHKIIYSKIRALVDVQTRNLIKLRPHHDYPYLYFLDPMRIKDGAIYEVLLRDYSNINRSILESSSLALLRRRFNHLAQTNESLSYSDYIHLLNIKKKQYKNQVKMHVSHYFEKSDAYEKVHLKKHRIQDVARMSIEKGEDTIDEIIRLSFEAMDAHANGAISFEEFCDHWSRMYVMKIDVSVVPRKLLSEGTPSTPSTPFISSRNLLEQE